jgi:hypothetical protein
MLQHSTASSNVWYTDHCSQVLSGDHRFLPIIVPKPKPTTCRSGCA